MEITRIAKVIKLGLQSDIYDDIRSEAARRQLPVSLVVELLWTEDKLRKRPTTGILERPVVLWTPAEEEKVRERMQYFLNHGD